MRVTQGGRTILDVRAKALPGDDVVTEDYYAQLAQIRLTANPTSRQRQPEIATDIILDDTDVAKLVECAVAHPNPNMRHAVLAAIWNHPDSFRRIFEFGLGAPEVFPEIRKIVAEALAKRPATPEAAGADEGRPVAETLLPRMPLPAHLRDRERRR